jgi:glucose/arabinose dehydrogenase
MISFARFLLVAAAALILGFRTTLSGQTGQPFSVRPLPLQPTKLNIPSKYAQFYRTAPDSVRLPSGFRMNVFHAGMQKARFFGWNRRGVLHITDMSTQQILALPDTNNDGIADTSYIAAAPFTNAHSMIFVGDTMYVAEPTQVLRLLDRDSNGTYETRTVFLDNIPNGGVFNHYTRTIVFDSVQRAFYLSVGAPCDACRADNPERAAILRFNADGSGRRIIATGLRNAIGLAIEPATGKLWATNADRNALGEEKPEEVITSVPEGSFHGWPIAYSNLEGGAIGNNSQAQAGIIRAAWTNFQANAEYRTMLPLTNADSNRVRTIKLAEALLPAHSTPMGIQFCTSPAFPRSFRNGAFVALHGSYDTSSRKLAVGHNILSLQARTMRSGLIFRHLSRVNCKHTL